MKVAPPWKNFQIKAMKKFGRLEFIEELLSVYIKSKEPANCSTTFKDTLLDLNNIFKKALAAGTSLPDLKTSKVNLPCVVQPMDS